MHAGGFEAYFLSFLSSRVPKYAKQAIKSRKSAATINPSFPIVDPLSEVHPQGSKAYRTHQYCGGLRRTDAILNPATENCRDNECRCQVVANLRQPIPLISIKSHAHSMPGSQSKENQQCSLVRSMEGQTSGACSMERMTSGSRLPWAIMAPAACWPIWMRTRRAISLA